jgi:16S rRNA (cytidine1402-2'-O)-methyltransferase
MGHGLKAVFHSSKGFSVQMMVGSIVLLMALTRALAFSSSKKGIWCHFRTCKRLLASIEEGNDQTSRKVWVTPGHVYFVATPIGNLHDISSRAIDILNQVDVICAEDTRNTIQLLRLLGIPHKKLISHHEHNEFQSIATITSLTKAGNSVAVVSDAGSPGIADPGAALASALVKEDVALHPVPGPSAVIAALSISGFLASEFSFLGFIPVKGRERKEKLANIDNIKHTVVLFEAPHRILRTLEDIASLSNYQSIRECVICRELTKKHEEILRGSVAEVLAALSKRNNDENKNSVNETDNLNHNSENKTNMLKGEFVVVLGPNADPNLDSKKKWRLLREVQSSSNSIIDDETYSNEDQSSKLSNSISEDDSHGRKNNESDNNDPRSEIISALIMERDNGKRRSEATKNVSKLFGAPKAIVYDIALRLPWD